MPYATECQVCGAVQTVPTYDDWTCEKCGQPYEYNEGHRIILSPDQLRLLSAREYREDGKSEIKTALPQPIDSWWIR